jgi:hypothetical protein
VEEIEQELNGTRLPGRGVGSWVTEQ